MEDLVDELDVETLYVLVTAVVFHLEDWKEFC